MSGVDTKPRFGGNGSKFRFSGGAAIRYGGRRKLQNQTNEEGPIPGIEDVFLFTRKSNAKMMTKFRKVMDALTTYVEKEYGGLARLMAAKTIRTSQLSSVSQRRRSIRQERDSERRQYPTRGRQRRGRNFRPARDKHSGPLTGGSQSCGGTEARWQ